MLTTLFILALLFIKHYIVDFVLQTNEIAASKNKYGSTGSINHAITHGFLTFLILFPFVPLYFAVFAEIADILIHYHVDYVKSVLTNKIQTNTTRKSYWILFEADQLLHTLTYLGIIMFLGDYV